jgi:hypothetical protein
VLTERFFILRDPGIAGLPAQIEQVPEQRRVVVELARHQKSFHDRAGLNNVKS